MKRLEGKVILLAGGAGGIGTATSLRLASEGAAVVVGDVNADEARAIAKRIADEGGRAIGVELDVGEIDSVNAFVEAGLQAFGGVDGLHANAALLALQHLDLDVVEIGLDMWDRLIQVDLTGYFYCTRAAVPPMLERGGGSIVYMSSGAAFIGEGTRVAYAVSKAGVNAIMRHVVTRWGKQGIRANSIAPGLVITPTTQKLPSEWRDQLLADMAAPRLGHVDDISAMVAMLMSNEASWIMGQVIGVDGGTFYR